MVLDAARARFVLAVLLLKGQKGIPVPTFQCSDFSF